MESKKRTVLFLPAIIVMLIFLAVLFVKGIFPFGSFRIDYYDMGQTNAPLYYHIWDFLHGNSPLFYDWYINEGQNLSMGSAIQWNISPFNLFFLFIPRDLVLNSLSIYMGLHLAAMAMTMGYFLHKAVPKAPAALRMAAAVSYGLCGFTLTHYTIPTYLDSAVFLPLLALSLYRLLKHGKPVYYMLMLGFTTALSYYLSFMHLIFILLISSVWIWVMIPGGSTIAASLSQRKDKKTLSAKDTSAPEQSGRGKIHDQIRADRALKLSLATLGGLMLSSIMLLPAVFQMMLSSRFQSNLGGGLASTLVSILSSIGADEYYVKGWQLYGMELFLVIILIGIIKRRKEKRLNIFLISLCFIPCALIPFESINILWHFGTYYHYPIRCGYLIPFSILTAAIVYGSRIFPDHAKPVKKAGVREIICLMISLIAVISTLAITLTIYVNHNPWTVQELFKLWLIFAAVLSLTYLLLLSRHLPFFVLPLLLMELILGAYIGYGRPHFTDRFFADPEQSGDYVQTAMELKPLLPEADSGTALLSRIKNPDTDLNTNYGMILRRPTVTGWANTMTLPQQKSAEKMGYSTHFMRILDSGGTIFTDSLLGVSEMITRVGHLADYPIYEKKGEYQTSHGNYALYENTAPLPLITAVTADIKDMDFKDMTLDEIHNRLYSALGGNKSDFAILMGKEENGNDSRTISIQGLKAVYLIKGRADEILVNGKSVPVPTIGDMENKSYPAWFNDSLIYLGSFENESASIDCPAASRLLILDLMALKDLSGSLRSSGSLTGRNIKTEARSLSFEIDGSADRDMALLPLHADPGLSCLVNGKKTDLFDIGGILTGIPLSPGVNRVEISFMPPGLVSGIALSCLAALALAVYIMLNRKAAQKGCSMQALPQPLSAAALTIFTAISALAWFCLYVVPIGAIMIYKIYKVLLS